MAAHDAAHQTFMEWGRLKASLWMPEWVSGLVIVAGALAVVLAVGWFISGLDRSH